MSALVQDIAFALRGFRRAPFFIVVVVVTLAVGIGANTAIFSVVRGILLRPLPFPEDDRLVFMGARSDEGYDISVSIPNYFSWRELNTVYSSTGMFRLSSLNLGGDGEPERLQSVQVLGDLFATLGRAPALGRVFGGEETMRGAGRVVVLSHGLWTRRFGSDPEILGRTLRLNGEPYTAIGVMPAGFFFPLPSAELWVPMGVYADVLPWDNRGSSAGSYVIARLAEGVSIEQALVDMERVGNLVREEHDWEGMPRATLLRDRLLGPFRAGLVLLFAAVGFVLLIACANVANLLLSRAEKRQREIAVRSVLGAGNGRIVRQVLTESAVLGICGGGAGALLGWAGVRALLASLPPGIPFLDRIRLDGPVLLFVLAISLFTGALFGLAPALHALRGDLRGALQEAGGRAEGGDGRLRGSLVVSEVALAVVLLVGAALMLQSLGRLEATEPGFRGEGVMTLRIAPPASAYPDIESWIRLFERLLERVEAAPGVVSAAVNNLVPLASGGTESGALPDRRAAEPESAESCLYQAVSEDYFRTLGIPLLRGRVFTAHDTADTAEVAIVDETMAEELWPGQDPIGRRVAFEFTGTREAPEPVWREVVGVVGHVRHYELRSPSRIQIYVPFTQPPMWFAGRPPDMALFLRSRGDPAPLVAVAREALAEIDPELPLFAVRTMDEVLDQELATDRLLGSNLGIFAGVALLLAAVGLYGVLAYAVSRRTHEIGLRMALGATRRQILALVLVRALRLVGLGLALGVAAALAVGRFLEGLLYGVEAADPATLALIVTILALVALAASLLPAWRAARIDPLAALRYE